MELSEQEYTQIIALFASEQKDSIALAENILQGFGLSTQDFFIWMLLLNDWAKASQLSSTLLVEPRQKSAYTRVYDCFLIIAKNPATFSILKDLLFKNLHEHAHILSKGYNIHSNVLAFFLNHFQTTEGLIQARNFFTIFLQTHRFQTSFELSLSWLYIYNRPHFGKIAYNWDLFFFEFFSSSGHETSFIDTLWQSIKDFEISQTKYFFATQPRIRQLLSEKIIAERLHLIGLDLDKCIYIINNNIKTIH